MHLQPRFARFFKQELYPMQISAPQDRAVTVIVFEPSQDVTKQGEREIDRFDLAAGEVRELDYGSATAAYRLVPMAPEGSPLGEPPPPPNPDPTPPQEGIRTPKTEDEMNTGAERQQELASQEKRVAKMREQAAKHAGRGRASEAQERNAARKGADVSEGTSASSRDALAAQNEQSGDGEGPSDAGGRKAGDQPVATNPNKGGSVKGREKSAGKGKSGKAKGRNK